MIDFKTHLESTNILYSISDAIFSYFKIEAYDEKTIYMHIIVVFAPTSVSSSSCPELFSLATLR